MTSGSEVKSGPEGGHFFKPSGEFGLAEAAGLKEAMLEALAGCEGSLTLDLTGVESGDLTFFQLLFSLASQARIQGKRIVLGAPLPEPLRRAAGELGIAQRDFEQAFFSGDN